MPLIQLKGGRYLVNVNMTFEDDRIILDFPYNARLKDDVKQMDGSKWHGYDKTNPRKVWSIANNARNRFQLDYLAGKKPYAPYDTDLPDMTGLTRRDSRGKEWQLYNHQCKSVAHITERRQCILAEEMGLGKTLATFIALEMAYPEQHPLGFWVGPKSSLISYQLEAYKWKFKLNPEVMTYERLIRRVTGYTGEIPRYLVLDEAHLVKTPTSQRSQAAYYLAERMREEYGRDCFIILLTGTPAPKSPLDWYHLCEIARPGFLKEGNYAKFKSTLAIIEYKDTMQGGVYPELISWKDRSDICQTCGKTKELGIHSIEDDLSCNQYHPFEKGVNEVERLYKRLNGLVQVQLKKDCLDLPSKVYKILHAEPDKDTLRAAQLIKRTSARAITALTLLRELSDGFQYREIPKDEITCTLCLGRTKIEAPDPDQGIVEDGAKIQLIEIDCPECEGTGLVLRKVREATYVKCPKDDLVLDILDDLNDVGRCVFYAGFAGSIDKLAAFIRKAGWDYIKVDGRGWDSSFFSHRVQMVQAFQKEIAAPEKIAFIGHPGSAGMGLTLTASPVIVYYSNDFNAMHRIQSEDRIHRPGMDVNRGATIIDLIHLPSDLYVLQNLKKKRRLQDISMGVLNEEIQESITREDLLLVQD